jgi:predicted Zn-dependent protease
MNARDAMCRSGSTDQLSGPTVHLWSMSFGTFRSDCPSVWLKDLVMSGHPLAMLLMAALPIAAQERPATLYNLEKEAALGKALAEETIRTSPLLDAPNAQTYVRLLGQKIAAYVPDAKFPFAFSVIANDECRIAYEPTALPGGHILAPAALFVAAQDEAEFAGMLAHAMAHVTQRHGTRQDAGSRQQASANGGVVPLIFIGGFAATCAGGAAIPRAFLNSQRSAELEADVLAVQTMARAGFDPNALVRFINRVQKGATPQFNANSPMPDREQRVAAMRTTIDTLPPNEVTTERTPDFTSAREQVRRLIEQPARPRVPPSLFKKKPE